MTTMELKRGGGAVVEAWDAVRRTREVEAEAVATLDRLQRAVGGRQAGNDDFFDALAASEARAEMPAAEAARARAAAARIAAEREHAAVTEREQVRILTERAEARRPLVRRAYLALEAAAEVVREVQRYDAETDAQVGRSNREVFWVEFILSNAHHTALYDFRRARDEKEAAL